MRIAELEWDDENIEHIARHGASPEEVEDICFGQHIAIRGREGRYVLYGQIEKGGRHLRVVLKRLYGAIFRPITAFEMTEEDKHNFRKRVK